MPWARSLTENVVANLIASSITGAGAGLIGRANDLPTLSVTLLGIGAFSITLLVLMLMAVRIDKRAKAEAALPLLREVGIHMLLNRPLNQGVLERFGENMVWWRDRTVQELTQIGASEYYISRFQALGTLEVVVGGETPAHAHAKSVAATHLRRLEEAITALRI
jgi:hypothetical protein